VYAAEQKFKCVHSVSKMTVPENQEKGGGAGRQFRMWIDESLSFFFRRLTFSPDGNLLVVPAGRYENGDKATNMTYIFTKSNLAKPAVCLPCPEKATVVVKFCPKLFKLRGGDASEHHKSLFSLPYRMVYAVASLDAVLLYDTQQTTPFAYLSNIHYSGITDLAWSEDGLVLVITSSDAYCSIVTFEPGELGVVIATEDLPESMKKSNTVSETKKNGIPLLKSPVENGRKSAGSGDAIEEGKMNETEALTEPRATENLRSVKACGGNSEGGRSEVKGKRRIATTLMETFSSPASTSSNEKPLTQSTNNTSIATEKTQPVIQPDSRSSSTSPEQPATVETRLTAGQTSFTTARQASGEKETSKSPEKKPRRIQFQTLSQNSNLSSENESQTETPPLCLQEGSRDLRPKSCDPGSAHSSAGSNEAELMDVQTVE
jgi:hypothetical protein